MTKDLEETLNELGPEYRSVVGRLRAPFAAPRRSPLPYLLAASLIAVVGFSIWCLPGSECRREGSAASAPRVYTVAYANDEYALQAIVDSQQSDGSWSNDYLTMQNAAALRKAGDTASQIAYKRAVRYLRTKGLDPISDAELRQRSVRVFPAG